MSAVRSIGKASAATWEGNALHRARGCLSASGEIRSMYLSGVIVVCSFCLWALPALARKDLHAKELFFFQFPHIRPHSASRYSVFFATMTSPAHFISATADDDDMPFSGTCLVFTLGVATPLQVDGVNARFFDFAFEEHRRGTILQDFGSLSVARYELDHNPYATIIELEDRIKLLLRALNDINLHPSTTAATSNFISRVFLADGGDDDDDDDDTDDADDGVKGRPVHSVPSVRFEQGNDNDADNNGGGGASAD